MNQTHHLYKLKISKLVDENRLPFEIVNVPPAISSKVIFPSLPLLLNSINFYVIIRKD